MIFVEEKARKVSKGKKDFSVFLTRVQCNDG